MKLRHVGLLIIALVSVACSSDTADDGWESESTHDDVVTVYKTETCGCCVKWIDHLKANGFTVDVVNVPSTAPTRARFGVPPALLSCHTGTVNGYWVEGHVPADLVRKLIAEKPGDIRGISAPGMPIGSPGMEGPNPVEYDIVAYHANGSTTVYARRQGKETAD